MPLPQQVVEQLGREPGPSRSWASGALFSPPPPPPPPPPPYGAIMWYSNRVSLQIQSVQDQVVAANQSVSSDEQQQIIDFYSQATNLKGLLASHTYTTGFLGWLEGHTQGNIYYQNLSLTSGGKVVLKGVAKSEADINQQIDIFENASGVSSVVVSNIAAASQAGSGTSSGLTFNVTLVMQPSVFDTPAS